MKICPKCNTVVSDDTIFCAECGTRVIDNMENEVHDEKVNAEPVSAVSNGDNKIFAIIPYILGLLGIIISILAAKDSSLVMHHVKESLKFEVLTILTGIVSVLLSWTFIVPIAGGIFMLVLLIARIIAFVNACKGEDKPAPIVSSIKFLN